jgi:hypothetical protein
MNKNLDRSLEDYDIDKNWTIYWLIVRIVIIQYLYSYWYSLSLSLHYITLLWFIKF